MFRDIHQTDNMTLIEKLMFWINFPVRDTYLTSLIEDPSVSVSKIISEMRSKGF